MTETKSKPACSRCGNETTGYMGDVIICDECYIIRCSCCPEFGPDDLAAKAIEPTNH